MKTTLSPEYAQARATALAWKAVQFNDLGGLKIALSRGANIHAPAPIPSAPPKGPDPWKKQRQAGSLILMAAWTGRTAALRVLRSEGASVSVKNKDGFGLVSLAFESQSSECASLVLDWAEQFGLSIDEPGPSGRRPLALSALGMSVAMTRRLIDLGADVNKKPQEEPCASPIRCAAESGKFLALKALLEAGARIEKEEPCSKSNMNSFGEFTLSMLAEKSGNADCLRLLAAHGVNLDEFNPSGVNALIQASRTMKTQLSVLLELGVCVDAIPKGKVRGEFKTALGTAVSGGFLNHVQALLEAGASPQSCGIGGQSAFHLACTHNSGWSSSVAMIRLLAQYGARPNQPDDHGLMPASKGLKRAEILEALLDAGADPNVGSNGSLLEEACLIRGRIYATDSAWVLAKHGVQPTRAIIEAALAGKMTSQRCVDFAGWALSQHEKMALKECIDEEGPRSEISRSPRAL